MKFDPSFSAGIGKDLTARYAKLWADRRDRLITKARMTDLHGQVLKADAKTLSDLAKDFTSVIDEYDKRWPGDALVAMLRNDLANQQLKHAKDAVEQDSIKLEASWKRLMQLPAPDAIKSTQPQIEGLLQKLKTLAADLQARKDSERAKWTDEMIALYTKRRDFLPEALTLLDGMDRSLADGRIMDFFENCATLLKNCPEDAKHLVRRIAEEFCTRYLVKPPKEPLKYDDFVTVIGIDDKTEKEFPRKQVRIYFKKEKDGKERRRFMEDGDPFKNDGYTEFHADRDKQEIYRVTVFDKDLKDPLDSMFIQLPIENLKPTKKSSAVRFYCEEYRKVDRWNAAAIREFVKKCEPHKDHLGEIWSRLNTMDKAMNGAKELFAAAPQ